ncbi:MAG: 5-oxoprolinase subunit PxpA [candidate division KSB1 bacterium]
MVTHLSIDLNADLGEQPHAMLGGSEEKIIRMISSANIACGGHAGDESTMAQTLALCAQHQVSCGAHPSFPDRANFGRSEMPLTANEVTACVFEQVRALGRIAQAQHVALQHVKPHGALYNLAAKNKRIAEAIALGVARWSRDLVLVGLAHSAMLEVWQALGFRIAAEAFVDRVYEADGSLRSRARTEALIQSPEAASAQALRIITGQGVIASNGVVVPVHAETLCIHSDTPNALALLTALRAKLNEENIAVAAFSKKKGFI